MSQRWWVAPVLILIACVLGAQETEPIARRLAALEKRVAEAPRDLASRVSLARLYAKTGNLEGQVEQLRALRRLAPEEPEYAYQLGRVYLALSAAYLKRISSVDPSSGRPSQALGESYFLQGKSQLAMREFKRALKADPSLPGIHLLLAQIYSKQGKRAAALDELNRELAIVPSSAMALALRKQLGSEESGEPRR